MRNFMTTATFLFWNVRSPWNVWDPTIPGQRIKAANKVHLTHRQDFSSCLPWCIRRQRNAVNSIHFSPSIGNKMKKLWPKGVRLHGQCHWVADQQRRSASHFSFIEWIYTRDFQSRLIVGLVFSTGYSRLRHVLGGCTQPIELTMCPDRGW